MFLSSANNSTPVESAATSFVSPLMVMEMVCSAMIVLFYRGPRYEVQAWTEIQQNHIMNAAGQLRVRVVMFPRNARPESYASLDGTRKAIRRHQEKDVSTPRNRKRKPYAKRSNGKGVWSRKIPCMWVMQESNLRPLPCEGSALAAAPITQSIGPRPLFGDSSRSVWAIQDSNL